MITINHVSFPGLGIDLTVDRVAFHVFGLSIFWYGILIAFAVLLSVFLAMRHAPRYGLVPDDVLDVVIAVVPLSVVFARLYYVAFAWDSFKSNLLSVFDVRSGGLAFYGGVIGGFLGILLVARIKRIRLHRIVDFLVVYLPLGQAIGRWGNFFNQEAFGSNTTLPWGMKSEATEAYLATVAHALKNIDPTKPVHPTFLYEFLANMAIFAILLVIRKRSRTAYVPTLAYLGMYGFVRFFVEGIRTDALPATVFGLTFRVSQVLSLVMFVVSVVLLWIIDARNRRKELEALLHAEPPVGSEGSGEPGDAAAGDGTGGEKDGPSGT